MRRFVLLTALLALGGAASAQSLRDEAQALIEAKRQAALADKRSAALEIQAQQAASEAGRARAAKAAVAARILSAEADIAAAEARTAIVRRLRERQRARLAERQQPVVRLAAALQVMARRPPALALVQPGSLADLVHVRTMLGSTLPLVRERTAGLRAEVSAGLKLQAQADEAAATLRDGRLRLARERQALASLEANSQNRAQTLTDSAMAEQDRAMALGEEARDIVDLMGSLSAQAELRDRLASLPGPILRPPIPGRAALPQPDLVVPVSARLPYRLPVVGRLLTGFGEVSDAGIRARGLTLATRPQAQVVAPAAGRILYAGAFRGYGRIVIIDHGGGWTSLLTNMAALDVQMGEAVDRGSPLGRTAAARPSLTVELRRGGRPVNITGLIGAG